MITETFVLFYSYSLFIVFIYTLVHIQPNIFISLYKYSLNSTSLWNHVFRIKFAVRIRITKVKFNKITFCHLASLLKYKFHFCSRFRNTPHKQWFKTQISCLSFFLLTSKNKMCVLCHMKCGKFWKVCHSQKQVNCVPISQVHICIIKYSVPTHSGLKSILYCWSCPFLSFKATFHYTMTDICWQKFLLCY